MLYLLYWDLWRLLRVFPSFLGVTVGHREVFPVLLGFYWSLWGTNWEELLGLLGFEIQRGFTPLLGFLVTAQRVYQF